MLYKKNIKFNYLLIIIFIIFLASANSVFAAQVTSLPTLVKNFFSWAIGIASTLAGLSFGLGAVQYIISESNPTTKSDAKSRMTSSLIGLVLLLGSYLILNTINPKINTFQTAPLGQNYGILYTNGNPKEEKPAPLQEANTTIVKDLGYNTILYQCLKGKDGKSVGIPIFITFFPEYNYKDSSPVWANTKQIMISCGGSANVSTGRSFKISFMMPGVYLYMENGCKGLMSEPYMSDNVISNPFLGRVKSIKIIGSNFFKDIDFTLSTVLSTSTDTTKLGSCTAPFYDKGNDNCYDIKISPKSISIMKQVNPPDLSGITNYFSKGKGLKFFSKPWGWKEGAFAGYNDKTSKDNRNFNFASFFYPDQIFFTYKKCSGIFTLGHNCETQEYKNMCTNLLQCPGSIQLSGNHYIIFYSNKADFGTLNNKNFTANCQIFSSNINSIKEKEFTATGNQIGSIVAIPIK